MPQSMPESALTRNYLDLMVELPWSKQTTGTTDTTGSSVPLFKSTFLQRDTTDL